MAEITRFFSLRHLRSESSSFVLHQRAGARVASGRGLSFWFLALSASISELPMDDRELQLLLHGRSQDFQDVSVQVVLAWRVADPELLASRVDFSIDLATGVWLKQPLEKITSLLGQLAQQIAWDYLVRTPLRQVMVEGVEILRERLRAGLSEDPGVSGLGVTLVSAGISAIRPSPDVEKALQTPTREAIQQDADKATFERRALAVERERAIAENELQNRIELAKREEVLIAQTGTNERRKATELAEAERIRVAASAANVAVERGAEAEGIRLVEAARVDAERARIEIYRALPPEVLLGLAARDLAGNLPAIETLNLGGDALGPLLERLARSGARKLERDVEG